ncbi:MAG: PrsW family glutamic-type intramembrane protease [Spirochaetales bacterium]|nr:PrsW family glutamic-type intramembrane protease [Spirochaetales bacterium]
MYYMLTLLLLPQVINFLLALLPALILLNYFYKKDPRPEPRKTVTRAFLLGIAAILPALVIEFLFSWLTPRGLSPLVSAAVRAFLIAALVEESCKMAVINRFIYPRPEFDEVNDGIVYTMAAGLGFAFFENILYSLNSGHPWSVLLIRGVTSIPLHGLASGLMGYYIGKSKFSQKDLRTRGLLWAVFYHGLYDFFLFTGSSAALFVIPLLIILYLHTRSKMKKAVDEDIREYRV